MSELKVEDMTCGHCAATIARAVRDVDAAARCDVDLGSRIVRIGIGEPVSDFVLAIREAGYSPVVISGPAGRAGP